MGLEGTEVPQKYKAEPVKDSPLGFSIHPLGNGRGNNATCKYLHHASSFAASLCHTVFAQGEGTHRHTDHNQGSLSPTLLFLANPETSEKTKYPQQTSAPHQEQAQTPAACSSQNQQCLPSSYKNLPRVQPFYEAFQQIYGSSCSQLHYTNSSNASIKNPALPLLHLAHLPISSESHSTARTCSLLFLYCSSDEVVTLSARLRRQRQTFLDRGINYR